MRPAIDLARVAGVFLACGALAAAAGEARPQAPAKAGARHTVAIDGTRYVPEVLTVKRGDSVTWVNKDPFPHTVTSGKAFDSASLGAGRSWTYVARKSGRYEYICSLHPNMKGTLVVE